MRDRRNYIEPGNKKISVRRQSELLELNQSGVYCEGAGESEKNRRMMAAIDMVYTENPPWGFRQISAKLACLWEFGCVNRKRVSRQGDSIYF